MRDGIAIPMSGDALRRLLGGGGDDEGAGGKPIPEAQIAILREMHALYVAPCRFKPGDIITPRPGSYKDAGEPHIVLEVREEPIRNFDISANHSEAFSNAYGVKLDIRVALLQGDRVEAYWQESWRHDPYTGPGI